MFFFFNDTATTEIYTLSLHDALPIYVFRWSGFNQIVRQSYLMKIGISCRARCVYDNPSVRPAPGLAGRIRPMNQKLRVPRQETSLRPRTTQTLRTAILDGAVAPGQQLSQREPCASPDLSRSCLRE